MLLPVAACMLSSCSIAPFPPVLFTTAPLPPLSPHRPPLLPPLPVTQRRLLPFHVSSADRDCSRLGLDFPVSSLPSSSPLSFTSRRPLLIHSFSCVSPPPEPHSSCVISKNMRVFRKRTSLPHPLLSLDKSRTFFLFPTSD